MSFYISKKDGAFKIEHSITNESICLVSFKGNNSYEITPVQFNVILPLGLKSTIYVHDIKSKNEYGCDVFYYDISGFL